MKNSQNKIYLIYHKGEDPEPELIAYTLDKDMYHLYRKQRHMLDIKGTTVAIIDLDDIDEKQLQYIQSLMYLYQDRLLASDILTDGENDMEIVATYKEISDMDYRVEQMQDTVERLRDLTKNHPDKKLSFIYELTREITSLDTFPVNTFKLFYQMNRDKFY